MARYNDLPNELKDKIIDFLVSTGGRSAQRGLHGLVLADKRQYYGFLPRLYKLNARLLRPFKLRTFHTKRDFHARQAELLAKGSRKVNRALCWAIVHGEVSTVSRVVSLTPESCRLCDVQYALKLGRVETAKRLLDVANVWETLLQWNRAVRAEVEGRPGARVVAHAHPLWLAVQLGNAELVKLFLEDARTPATFLDRDPVFRDPVTDDNWTPLHIACQLGHLEIVRLLLSHGTEHELQPLDSFSWYREKHLTPASLAIYAGHEDIVDELARVEPRVLTSAGNLALAALRPNRAMVKKCLAAGATPRTGYDVHGIVPLHAAIVGGDLDIVAEFLNLGSHARCVDAATTTEVKKKGSNSLVLSSTHFAWPLELAVNASPKANVDLVRLLLEYGAYEGKGYLIREDFLETRFNFMVQSCIRADDIACLEVLLQVSKLKPTAKFVGYARSPEMLQLLLRYGSDSNLLEDERGGRPVHIMAKKLVASRNKDATTAAVEAFIMLVKKSRDVNTRDFDGCTVLHICAEGMDEISYKYLCPTIEQKCAYEKHISLYVKTLLDLGARPLISSALGRTALHGAIHGKHWKAARLLVQAGPKAVNMRNEWGETPLHSLFGRYILLPRGLRRGRRRRAACTGQILDMLRLLVKHGADPNLPDASGFAPLFRALTEHSRKAVSCLLSLGADPNVRDRSSDTVLIRAAQVSSVGIVRLLVATGADVDARGGTWGTALIAAAARGRRDMFQALLSLGADPGIQDFYGKTAMDHIEKFGRFKNEIAHVLVRRRLPLPAGFVLAPLAEDLLRKRKRKSTATLDTENSQD